MFKKFIPILRRMFDAGWQPITHARVQGSSARVERYGSARGSEVLFAVYNPTSAPLAADHDEPHVITLIVKQHV